MATERMLLEDKGPFAPSPVLPEPLGLVSRTVQAWEGIVDAAHWDLMNPSRIDGADFYVGSEELGHLHLGGELHLATTRTLRELLVAQGLAEPFPWYDSWVQLPVSSATDARHAIWLMELSYRHIRGAPIAELETSIRRRGALSGSLPARKPLLAGAE